MYAYMNICRHNITTKNMKIVKGDYKLKYISAQKEAC